MKKISEMFRAPKKSVILSPKGEGSDNEILRRFAPQDDARCHAERSEAFRVRFFPPKARLAKGGAALRMTLVLCFLSFACTLAAEEDKVRDVFKTSIPPP